MKRPHIHCLIIALALLAGAFSLRAIGVNHITLYVIIGVGIAYGVIPIWLWPRR